MRKYEISRENKRKREIQKTELKKSKNDVDRGVLVMYTDTRAPKGALNR
ncbi:hypothetical protein [Faecalibacterium longum]|nr:hypothetical protein [Faecalibacterium longum CLA-AA-H236]